MIKNIPQEIYKFPLDFDVAGIHATALRILGEIGIYLGSQNCLELLASLDCKVDYKNYRAWIGEDLIKKSLQNVVPEYDLFDRDGESSVIYGGPNILLTSGAAAIRIKDFNGDYRNANLKDLESFTRIHDYYQMIDIIHTSVDAGELDENSMRIKMAAAVFKNTSKSAWFVASKSHVVETIYEMALAIRGSKQSLVSKPFFRIGAAPESVLGFQKNEIELLMKCAELGIPTGCEHYPIMGLTAPVTVSGALAITAANYLAAHVVKTAIDPTNQNVFPVMAGSFNMKNGEIITSSPEIWQYYLAGIKLGQMYKIPTFMLEATDSKDTDIQAIYEKSMAHIIAACAGVNNIFGATNELDAMNLASYEQLVIDLEVLSSISHFLKKIPISGGSDDFEIIKRCLDNKMFFLDDDHTLSHYKKFMWDSEIFIKDNFMNWKNKGMKQVREIAAEKAKKILSEHQPKELPAGVVAEIDRIAGF